MSEARCDPGAASRGVDGDPGAASRGTDDAALVPLERPASAAGMGEFVLDYIVEDVPGTVPQAWAGGSALNILAWLAYLGWTSRAVARIGDDGAGRLLRRDIARWGIDDSLLLADPSIDTGVIVERIERHERPDPVHSFSLECPFCAGPMKWVSPYPPDALPGLSRVLPPAQVFLFDIPDPVTLEMARESRKRGALVYFEPIVLGEDDLVLACIETADIVKHSDEMDGRIDPLLDAARPPIRIVTHGANGLEFRLAEGERSGEWRAVPACRPVGIVDACGSGDTTSAGILHILGREGRDGLDAAPERVEEALRFGQALASVNLLYPGARGAMMRHSRGALAERVARLLAGEKVGAAPDLPPPDPLACTPADLCPHCRSRGASPP